MIFFLAKQAKARAETGYDAEGNEIDANGNLVERGKYRPYICIGERLANNSKDSEYNAAGEEIDENGNVVEKRTKTKTRAETGYDAEGNEIDENGNLIERGKLQLSSSSLIHLLTILDADGYDADGNEIDASGNIVERQNTKKNKKGMLSYSSSVRSRY